MSRRRQTSSPPAARSIDKALGLLGVYDVITVNSSETWRSYQSIRRATAKHLVRICRAASRSSRSKIGRQESEGGFQPTDRRCFLIGSVARLHRHKQLDAASFVVVARRAVRCVLPSPARVRTRKRLRKMAQEARRGEPRAS